MIDFLELGCGHTPHKAKDGERVVNHDWHKFAAYVDVAHDLNIMPWPWEAEQFDIIRAWAVLEHLYCERFSIFDECWRILKPNGLLVMKLPYWNNESVHDALSHYWFTTMHQFDQFDPTTTIGKKHGFYVKHKWRVMSSKWSNAGKSSIVHKLRKI